MHGRGASESCLSEPPKRSAARSPLNGSGSTRISRRFDPRSGRSDCLWLAGLVVVALVTWRKGSREGVAAVWKLVK